MKLNACAGGAPDGPVREGSLQAPLSQDSDGGHTSPLADRDPLQKSSGSSSGNSGGGSGGDASAAAGQTAAAANVAAAAGAAGANGGRNSTEREFVSVNGPLSPIAEHITHSEINSETTSSTMGDGSRMGSSTAGMGSSTAGISHGMPPRPTSGGSSLNPQFRTAVGDTVAAESSLLDPSESIMSQSQYDESSAVVPQSDSIAFSGAAVGAAAAGAEVAGAAAMAEPDEDEDEHETFHSVQRTSLQDTMPRDEEALASSEDVQPGVSYGAAAYPKLVPSATGHGTRGESSSLDHGLASVTQLGSMGIADMSDAGSQSRSHSHSHHSHQGAVLPSSQASSVDLV